MGTRESLLEAIIAEPENDLARLVYADWLDEFGTAAERGRAQFIRLQIEAEHTGDAGYSLENDAECARLFE